MAPPQGLTQPVTCPCIRGPVETPHWVAKHLHRWFTGGPSRGAGPTPELLPVLCCHLCPFSVTDKNAWPQIPRRTTTPAGCPVSPATCQAGKNQSGAGHPLRRPLRLLGLWVVREWCSLWLGDCPSSWCPRVVRPEGCLIARLCSSRPGLPSSPSGQAGSFSAGKPLLLDSHS